MYRRSILLLLSCLVFAVGCNPGVFVSEDFRFKASADRFEVSDVGDTMTVYLNKEDWQILDVLYTEGEVTYYQGNMTEGDQTMMQVPMQMKGLGQIWRTHQFCGFRLVRERSDALTVIMAPNLTDQQCKLQIRLALEIQVLELTFLQHPSEGFIIERIEWEDQLSSVGTHLVAGEKKFYREIRIQNDMQMDDQLIGRPDVMRLLKTESVEFPVPDPEPVDMKLTFSGSFISLRPYVDTYKIDMDPIVDVSTKASGYTYYVSYSTAFHMHLKHVRDDSFKLCFTGHFRSNSPILK